MDLNKHLEFFNPSDLVAEECHVIGVGAVGSEVAEQLARLGVEHITLYDFDTVEPKNLANQNYIDPDIGNLKTEAMMYRIECINAKANVELQEKYIDQQLSGWVFVCVDSIEIRKQIISNNKYNATIKGVFDWRMRLTDIQHYAAKWNIEKDKKVLEDSMDFTEEEAKEATPVSACGSTLAILPTIRAGVSLGIANFINMAKGEAYKKIILLDAFKPIVNDI